MKCINTRQGRPTTPRPIVLLARNLQPEATCATCGAPATRFCTECLIEEDQWQTFCERHAKTHPHKGYGPPVPLVNSPRLGLCGYDGPAEPPY